MQFTTRQKDGITVADLSGRLTAGVGATILHNQIERLLDAGVRSIILNMAGLQMIDSSGIGELNGGSVAVASRGGRLKLCNMPVQIRDALQISKLLSAFEVYDDEIDAIKSF